MMRTWPPPSWIASLERGRLIHLDGPSGRTRHLNLEEVLPAAAERARISGIRVPEFPGPTGIKIWNGRANLDEFEGESATGHIEGLTLRTYNPKTHQWSLYWANSKDGKVVVPQIGQFKDGRGEFYAQDMLNGKSIFVRFVWTNTITSMPHFEQSFSDDGGKTWEANWITDSTRVNTEPDKVH
jgi:hypothetical protein